MKRKPTFLIIGASKAGTTTIWHLLRQHPNVFLPTKKEPWFFSHDEIYCKGWEWYESHFQCNASHKAVGEASASYCMIDTYPETRKRIARHLDRPKIIFCVRDPIRRLESAWKQCLSTNHRMPRPFTRAVREYPRFMDSASYWKTVQAYRDMVGDENIHITFFEDLTSHPEQLLRECFKFLDVDPDVVSIESHVALNRSVDKRILPPKLQWFVQSSAWQMLKNTAYKRLPRTFRSSIRRGLSAPIPSPEWDDETLKWVKDQLHDDIRCFLEFTGKPSNFWEI